MKKRVQHTRDGHTGRACPFEAATVANFDVRRETGRCLGLEITIVVQAINLVSHTQTTIFKT
jgi:hypothetical protein